jgi:hypothetical protein
MVRFGDHEGESVMTRLEQLFAYHEICVLKARRDHAVDQKDWATYAALHSDDYVAMSIGDSPIKGGQAAAEGLAKLLSGLTTIHHSHTPVITFDSDDEASGVWAMEDNLFWHRDGEKQWLRGFGFYHERYVRGADGVWRFSFRRLDRTHAETSLGSESLAFDVSQENGSLGVKQ